MTAKELLQAYLDTKADLLKEATLRKAAGEPVDQVAEWHKAALKMAREAYENGLRELREKAPGG